ncbi:xanthine dehydrogenase accessory protein XdhC [Actimicrobium sp. CCC2.4]|uniref:xanthine dehydrogenase accessory protein XdhC n=1 Tax=Actimicrobium sp. CCC2.4 TaxID=3048606 RepID=UPI002AC978A9|nr:xanthine dehydrogenase accessory protein XdhC [Actimicrobium sp. CCC2.4]MEB0135750.1 xanthine dehydrogenase accessory protein XdhC [Actimicrobium sp. CCC2.4]WPX33233.1 xanthine dehydrogenase accessory protein XdhC [Actimicrobium sp. CCC2.4]
MNAVLVTVASVEGSAPREAGATMLVTQDGQRDTIGGGHLELRACEIARAMLAFPDARRLERFALGPGLGQCCGGVVQLVFETVDASHRVLRDTHRTSWRVVALDTDAPPLLIGDETALASLGFDPALPTRIVIDAAGQRWLVDRRAAWQAHLLLFGAGHVGAAIVRALADLPCHVTWIDERAESFPATVPANVTVEVTDAPEDIVGQAAAGSSFLVMTHSHAIDQQLCAAILERNAAGWFGLIGSDTKRRQFEHRLLARGIPADRLAGMTCPVGIAGISGKAPAVIAVAVAAQLLQVWESA